eukprot:7311652-Heterocapsa_arctica.AAC.1
MSHLSFAERADFADAPVIMEFRKERANSDGVDDSCEGYNCRALYVLAKETDAMVARIAASYDGLLPHAGS